MFITTMHTLYPASPALIVPLSCNVTTFLRKLFVLLTIVFNKKSSWIPEKLQAFPKNQKKGTLPPSCAICWLSVVLCAGKGKSVWARGRRKARRGGGWWWFPPVPPPHPCAATRPPSNHPLPSCRLPSQACDQRLPASPWAKNLKVITI